MKKKLGKAIEIPLPEHRPESNPQVEPAEPLIPVEDPLRKEFPAISPFDFPPPGEGIFPELF